MDPTMPCCETTAFLFKGSWEGYSTSREWLVGYWHQFQTRTWLQCHVAKLVLVSCHGALGGPGPFPDLSEIFRRGRKGTKEGGVWLWWLETAKGFFTLLGAKRINVKTNEWTPV